MKILCSCNHINFKGFKNVVSDDLNNGSARFSFIAAELTNDNFKDLDEYKILLRDMKEKDSNLISVIYSKNCNEDVLLLNGKKLFWGNELKQLSKKVPENMYKTEEKNVLKAYTLLASITRRMMENGLVTQDQGFKSVFTSFHNILSDIILDKNTASEVLNHAAVTNKSADIVGTLFNKIINNTMIKFFR